MNFLTDAFNQSCTFPTLQRTIIDEGFQSISKPPEFDYSKSENGGQESKSIHFSAEALFHLNCS